MSQTTTAKSIDWDKAIEKIQEGTCALILGPDFTTSVSGKTHREALKEYILSHKYGKKHYSEDNPLEISSDEIFPFSTQEFEKRDDHGTIIRDFFQDLPPNPLFDKIASIPFHLIISLSADLFMQTALEKAGKQFQHHYYRKGYNPKDIESEPSSEYPLLYQMLGSVEKKDSLILTHQDLFKYIQGIFGNYSLPEKLREGVSQCEYFIFLGVQYEKWYLKLLLQVLGLHEPSKMINACRHKKVIETHAEKFFSNVLAVSFVEVDVDSYVNGLAEAWKGATGGSGGGQEEVSQENIIKLVKSKDIDAAFAMMERMDAALKIPVLKASTNSKHGVVWQDMSAHYISVNDMDKALDVIDWSNSDEDLQKEILSAKAMYADMIQNRDTLNDSDFQTRTARALRKVNYIFSELKQL